MKSRCPEDWIVKMLQGRGRVLKAFKSRKNAVWLVEMQDLPEPCVLKLYCPEHGGCQEIEEAVLREGAEAGLRVPGLLEGEKLEGAALMQMVSGDNLMDLLNSDADLNNKKIIIFGLADWLADFHKIFSYKNLAKGDCSLRNFLWDGDAVWGLDFEECGEGKPEHDLGDACTSILSSKPEYAAYKIELCQALITRYQEVAAPLSAMDEYIAQALEAKAKWRDDAAELLNAASIIAREGLK